MLYGVQPMLKAFHSPTLHRPNQSIAAMLRAADPWLQNAIDLAMLTTQQRIDIVQMIWSDIYDGYLHIAQ